MDPILSELSVKPDHGTFAPMASATCRIEFDLDDAPKAIQQLIARLDPILNLRSPGDDWAIFLSRSHVGVFASALIVSVAQEAERLGQTFTITMPSEADQQTANIGFFEWIHRGAESRASDASDFAVPLHSIDLAVFSAFDPILALVRRNSNISEEAQEYLQNSLNEVILNVEDHAESKIGALRCAVWQSVNHQLHVAIVDRGDGIFTTLRRRYPDTVDAEMALRRVIAGEFSAKSRPNNMGLGISNLWQHATTQLGGEIYILSENCMAIGRADREPEFVNLSSRFPGTGVLLIVPLEEAGTKP